MDIEYLTQPINSSGEQFNLSQILLNNLESREPFYNHVWIISAFTRYGALSLLLPAIRNSMNDGSDIKLILGIDMQGTSYEALIEVLNLGLISRIFKHRIPGHTFHPKIYVFESTDETAEIIIGSNNLTNGGIISNYEASVRIRYNLHTENELFQEAKNELSRYLNPPEGISLSLTQQLIDSMLARGDILPETRIRFTEEAEEGIPPGPHRRNGNQGQIPSPFGHEHITPGPRNNLRRPRIQPQNVQPFRPVNQVVPNEQGRTLLWQKPNLPASDVQRQPGHPTGGLRLVRAGFQVNGEIIDQTTYFRNGIFGNMEWTTRENPPLDRETITLPVEIYIDNHYYGLHVLVVSHKPTGEAEQGNYTTMLHWKDFGSTIRELNLIGKTFSLYSPVVDNEVPYLIIIN